MITAIIQARTGSTRLPNKIFRLLKGKPLIWHVVERLKWSKRIENIIIATTVNPKDDLIEYWASENSIPFFRGSEEDVLDRYYKTAIHYNCSTIVRITADDPFKDPEIIDKVIDLLKYENIDFAYNNNPPSFPEGLDTEVFSFSALEIAARSANDLFEREHVTQYFYRNMNKFKQKNLSYSKNISNLRWTIDTENDFKMAELVYENLWQEGKIFLLNDILTLLERKPEIMDINSTEMRSLMYKNNKKNEANI